MKDYGTVRVSVIIPFNKGDEFLTDCLNSLSAQEYTDYEAIIIADHYEGDIRKLIAPFEDKINIKLLELNGEKCGVAAARNAGLDEARGEFVYFLDADDYIFQDAIRTMVETSDDTNEDMVYGKKHFTYFRRDVFLPIYIEKREALIAQKYLENGGTPAGMDDIYSETSFDADSDSDSDNDDTDDDEDSEDMGSGESEDMGDDENDPEDGDEESCASGKVSIYDRFPRLKDFDTQEEKDQWLVRHYNRARRKAVKRLIYKKKRFRNISILHMLIRRSVIEELQLRFDENMKYYSDLPFLAALLNKEDLHIRKRFASHYIKRRHQDIVNHPALTQIQDEGRFDEMTRAFEKMLEISGDEGYVRRATEHQIAFYCSGYFLKKVKRSEAKRWKNERFKKMTELTQGVSDETLKKMDRWRRNAVKAVRAGDLEKSIRVITRRLIYKKLIKRLRGKNTWNRHLYVQYLKRKKVSDNVIMFETFFGKSYSDSPKYIYEYIGKNYPGKYKFVWVLDKKVDLPYGGKIIKRSGRNYMYYLATSKYFVFNVRQPQWFKKRSGQVFFETWHGTPLKRLGFDLKDVFGAAPNNKKRINTATKGWDYLLSPNEFSTGCFNTCFLFDKKKIVEYGYPRNDILHNEEGKELAVKVKEKLRLDPGKKLILYAPTWRDDECYGPGLYKFELKLELDKMKEALGDEYIVLLRTHYFIADSVDTAAYGGFAVNVSRYDDIAELYLISDILITDYSSVFFDFGGLRRPMLFYTYDLDRYRDILHGFYMDMEQEVPGPMLYTTEEVIDAIKNIDDISLKYKDRYEEFYRKYCSLEDGRAAERCVKTILGTEN